MAEHSIVRLAAGAPRVGTVYGFRNGEQTFAGTVIRVSAMRKAKTHVAVTVELSEREHRRLTLGEEVFLQRYRK